MTRPEVLVIEDDMLCMPVYEMVATSLGAQCVMAPDGRSARELLRSPERFSLVFLDLQLPDADGPSLLIDLQAMPELSGRLVIVTGFPGVAKAFANATPIIDKARISTLKPLAEKMLRRRQQ